MVRLYVHPASIEKTKYPYLMFNMPEWRRALTNNWFKHAIMDAGVERFFFFQCLKEYPLDFLHHYPYRAIMLTKKYGSKIWVTIPDYPNDYLHNQLQDNVERTFRNIERFYKIKNVNWIYPLQAKYLDYEGFVESCEKMKKYNPPRIGLGTVCKTKNIKFIVFCCKVAREYFPDAHIHAFGMTLKALPYTKHYIDSMDSSAWAYGARYGRCGIEEFQRWLNRFNKIIQTVTLHKFM